MPLPSTRRGVKIAIEVQRARVEALTFVLNQIENHISLSKNSPNPFREKIWRGLYKQIFHARRRALERLEKLEKLEKQLETK